jgi:nucleoside-diphosphate-sugar epimerase
VNVLLTGAFGNIGTATLEELLRRGHKVRCFDLKTKSNLRAAKKYKNYADSILGDLRHLEDVAEAVRDQEAVVHLAFVIPKLSMTGVNSEEAPDWSKIVNVGGTRNLLQAIKDQRRSAKVLFASSLHIYGRTQDQAPPRTVEDPPQPIEHYAHHKVECETMVQESGLEWAIFRLAASPPVRLILDPGMFEVPLNNRIEFVHSKDVALAIANALELREAWGRIWHIGGGLECQILQRELVEGVLDAVGVGMLPEEAFTKVPYPTDWLDTCESQKVLNFQRHTLQDYIQDVSRKLGFKRHLVRIFRPLIRAWLLRQSPLLQA